MLSRAIAIWILALELVQTGILGEVAELADNEVARGLRNLVALLVGSQGPLDNWVCIRNMFFYESPRRRQCATFNDAF